ncbi:MAG: hypothetical protein M1830_001042 [Pleopsidium flavum]|nr:MAG: hypothetical protein M1830_001042 [Pleopsidium flavum]
MASKEEYYDLPHDYANLDEVTGPSPDENPGERRIYRHESLEDKRNDAHSEKREHDDLERRQTRASRTQGEGEDGNLSEIAAPPPVSHDVDLPRARSHADVESSPTSSQTSDEQGTKIRPARQERVSKFATQLFTVSYLIFFSILGTLARLGLQALTFYPGAPVQEGVLWANFAGSLFMGFLSEDRKLFSEGWDPTDNDEGQGEKAKRSDEGHNGSKGKEVSEDDRVATKKKHSALKKTIPLYIGLATGFCGSLTSFSSFTRDVFLTLSNDLPTTVSHSYPGSVSTGIAPSRNGGYSFMAFIAVILLTVCLCLGALQFGAHLAIAVEAVTPAVRYKLGRKILDRGVVVIAWGTWLGAIFMSIWPPDRPGGPNGQSSWSLETWRGEAIFALVFAPLGCLLRFYASTHLNGRIASFPLGTFTVNILGTIILGMCYDLQHAPLGSARHIIGGGRIGCQVLQGVMDGFCGCLTTVSTWVVELKGLKKRHAYIYGVMSVGVALAFLVVIMGSLRWTIGFSKPACVT